MKNIWEIFRRDIKRIKNSVIAMIVIMGITVVPCLYAWFNIAASWDPYGNTGNLKVAVASVDEGYEGSLIPLQINMGDQVLTSLRSNSQLDWVFTGRKKAIDGVKSGKYYAAIVIPKDFSSNMMSIFSENIQYNLNSGLKIVYLDGRASLLHLLANSDFYGIGIYGFSAQDSTYQVISVPVEECRDRLEFGYIVPRGGAISDITAEFIEELKHRFSKALSPQA